MHLAQENRYYPLTHPQQRVWYTEKLHPGTSMWNNAGTLKITGVLDFDLLREAVNLFIKNNDGVRIRVLEIDGVPYQYISEYSPVDIELFEFADTQQLYEWDTRLTQSPMPLIDCDLFYFALYRLDETSGGLYAKFHHIISDALSVMEFANQVMETYNLLLKGIKPDDALRPSYLEYIRQEKDYFDSKRFNYDKQYWNDRFSDFVEPTVLKHKKSDYYSTRSRRKTNVIPAKLSAQIREFCDKTKISVFSMFLASLSIYISRTLNKSDILISAPVYNRTTLQEKKTFGMYVSTVPIRIEVNDELTFTDFAQNVSDEWFSVLKHQKYPYDMLIQDVRKKNKDIDSLYDITLSYQYGKFQKNTEFFTYEGRWHFPGYQATSLCIHINDREDTGKFVMDYDHHIPLFFVKEMDYIHTHMMNIIQDAIANPEKKLFEINLLTEEEKNKVLYAFNNNKKPYKEDRSLTDMWYSRFGHKIKPECTAVINRDKSVSYGELEKRSNRLAWHLKSLGISRDSIVAILTSRTIDYFAAMLGILKAGGAFMPIDPELPTERIAYMLQDSGSKAIIASPQYMEKCPKGVRIIDCTKDLYGLPEIKPDIVNLPQDLAYIIYTSGSTGQPKGVMIEHRSVINFVYTLSETWDFSPGAVMLCASSVSFDLSIMETILPLMNGGVIVQAREDEATIPAKLADLIINNNVNIMMVTPGRMEILLSHPAGVAALRNFRNISMGGDVLPQPLLQRVQSATNAKIHNLYGPTEITICATCANLTNAKMPNIGKPLPNFEVYILDKYQHPVSIGTPGEIYIGGAGLARGYINKPYLNAERFVENPFKKGQRLYRTGDLARWYPMGDIEFLGRIDQQVKIKGYRIELGEIESKLRQINGITSCAVIDCTDAEGRKYLCAYLVGNVPPKSEIKAVLSKELPHYMIPSYYVTLDSLPLTSSGKVDRRRLPELVTFMAEDDYDPPETATEQALSKIWSDILGIERIGRNDSFFDIGGDSLSIIKMIATVEEKFQVEIPLDEVYRSPMLNQCAELIESAKASDYRPIVKTHNARSLPATSAQKRMWIITNNDPTTLAYNIPIAFEIKGQVDADKLQKALNALPSRHEALRTSFVFKNGELYQQFGGRTEIELMRISCEPRKLKATLKSLVRPFDLGKSPLMRAALIKLTNGNSVFFMDMHHSIGDKRSAEILLDEISLVYSGQILPNRRLDYSDYTIWNREYMLGETIMRQKQYWLDTLSGELPVLNLNTDYPRKSRQRSKGARLKVVLPHSAAEKLKTFVQENNSTLFTAVTAAYSALLFRYTGQEDIIIGAPVAGRSRADMADIVGVFINTLPIRNRFSGTNTFKELFDIVRENVIRALANPDYPLDMIVSDLNVERSMARNPLFDTMIVHVKGDTYLRLGNLKGSIIDFDPGVAKLDITLEVYEGQKDIEFVFEYDTSLFKQSTIKRMAKHFIKLAQIMASSPDTPVYKAEMLDNDEFSQIVYGFNNTDTDNDLAKPVQSLLEEIAVSDPDKPALVVNCKTMTFARLNNRANAIAHRLIEMGVTRNTVVALLLRRSFDMVAALFGVLKAGGGYLPLDPDYPHQRVSFMLKDSGANVLITDGSSDMDFSGNILDVREVQSDKTYANPDVVNMPTDACYIIYTSGSTGVPKGCVLPRRAMMNLYYAANRHIAYNKDEVSVSITTVTFDIFVIDALLPLLNGCTVALANEEELRQPHLLAKLIESVDAKFIQTTPTRMRILMDDKSFRTAVRNHINKIVLGGEEYPLSLLKLLKKHTRAKLISGYGPTETTVYCSFKDLTNTNFITIGKPYDNTYYYILDKYMQPAPFGVLGEVYISGACVANGYINRDELNSEKFLPDPYRPGNVMYKSGDICALLPDGEFIIRGRADHQIKLRGLRIELGEIEAQMRAYKGITHAVVMAVNNSRDKYLCGYYEADSRLDEQELRNHLAKKLPVYMVPSYFVYLEKMPTTLNGKIDRKALPLPQKAEGIKQSHKLSDIEKKMAKAWRKVLGVENIGPDDNFFALGGDSLSVIRVQSAVLKYGWTLKTQDFYDHGTLRKICECITLPAQQTKAEKIRINKMPNTHPQKPAPLKNVLLTGCTGYLGAHVLRELVKNGSSCRCLIRAKSAKQAEERLKSTLRFYFGTDELASKVDIIPGELASLSDIRNIDTIVHCAAITDHVGNAKDFAEVNVEGTRNAVKCALINNASLLHISTVSVSGARFKDEPDKHGIYTENDFYIGQDYAYNQYVKSKFLAENIIWGAVKKGLDARVFRVGVLTARHTDGIFQIHPEKNAFANRIKALDSIGLAPYGILENRLEMTPVDLCSEAIIKLSQVPASVFHVFNPNLITTRELVELLNKTGMKIETVPDDEFSRRIIQLSNRGEYSHLLGINEDLDNGESKIIIDCGKTTEYLDGLGFKWPLIDEVYVTKFVHGLVPGLKGD